MIGQLLAGHTQIIGKLRRIPRPVLQCHQHPGTGLIRERMPETRQHRHITHNVHEIIVHLNLNSRISEPSRAARAPTPEHEQGKDRPAPERAARGCPRIPGTTWDESYQGAANRVDRVLPLRGEDHSVSDHFREGSIGGRVRCRRHRCLQRREEAQDKTPVRKAAVCATEVSLRAARRVEVHAESRPFGGIRCRRRIPGSPRRRGPAAGWYPRPATDTRTLLRRSHRHADADRSTPVRRHLPLPARTRCHPRHAGAR